MTDGVVFCDACGGRLNESGDTNVVAMPIGGSVPEGEDGIQVLTAIALAHVQAALRLCDQQETREDAARRPRLAVLPGGLESLPQETTSV